MYKGTKSQNFRSCGGPKGFLPYDASGKQDIWPTAGAKILEVVGFVQGEICKVSLDPRIPRIPRIQDPRFSSLGRRIRGFFRDPRFDRENLFLLRGIRGLLDVFEKGSAVQFHRKRIRGFVKKIRIRGL